MPRKKNYQYDFEQMHDNHKPFLVPNGEGFTISCCDCGSSHDIYITHSPKKKGSLVTLEKNRPATAAARKAGVNAILVSKAFYRLLRLNIKLFPVLLEADRRFQKKVASGDFLA